MHRQEAEAVAVVFTTVQHRNMDLSVLPNNNHPDKFLQLEVKSLVKSSALLQASWAKFPDAALPGVQRWHNRVYLQREMKTVTELPGLDLNRVSPEVIDKALGKHITPITLKSTIKNNPLYSDIQVDDDWEEKKKTPSWTVQDYDRHSLHSDLASHIKSGRLGAEITSLGNLFERPALLWVKNMFNNQDDRPRGSQCPELEDHDCKNDQLPVNPEIVQDLLLQLDPYKSTEPDEIYPRILKELDDVIANPHLIFEWSWKSGEVLAGWKLANVVLIFKKGKKEDPRNYKPVNLTSGPGKVMAKIILGGIEKHLKDNAVIGLSQHGFMRGKSCLTNLISFHDEVKHVADQRKPADVSFLDFCKIFNTVSHRTLLGKMSSTQLD
ncbi:hypothetical protein WISP_30579 [Willisornis vidua]|uniref:Major intrinsically disordered Notch2-binding receptor 1-like C-terminal domain-containing protein n=1 Tax=Willisornis vidua TaxID=1566151 RepID=A0ABQ9DPS4_9PASS|nr:hypothetical protein WISP_30579 [Willisornis vidua]